MVEVMGMMTPLYRSYDGFFTFRGPNGIDSRCYLQIYEAIGAIPVVIATETAENPGMSVTGAAEELATQVWRLLLPRAREGFRLIEVYRRPTSTGRTGDAFDEVDLIVEGHGLGVTGWIPTSRAAVEALIGGPFSVPVASSY